jgi:DNA-binding PadR family transcriptional regulator
MMVKSDLPQGTLDLTLDLLVLKIAALAPIHGYAIAQRLQQRLTEAVGLILKTSEAGAE